MVQIGYVNHSTSFPSISHIKKDFVTLLHEVDFKEEGDAKFQSHSNASDNEELM